MDDLRAVSNGHAVSSLGYEVKVDRKDLSFKHGDLSISWSFKKTKNNSLVISRKSREVKLHKGAKPLDERKGEMIEDLVLKALVVLRMTGEFAK